jgi:hypothetical protein
VGVQEVRWNRKVLIQQTNEVKEDEMSRERSMNGTKRNAYGYLMGKPNRKRPLGRPRRRWEANIENNLKERGQGGTDCIDLAQDRGQWRVLVTMIINLWVPQKVWKFLSR